MATASATRAHLLDWTVVINGQLMTLSSLELAANCKYFYDQFKQIEASSGSNIGILSPGAPACKERLTRVTFDHPDGLALMLRLLDCLAWRGSGDAEQSLDVEQLAGLVRAAVHFQAPRMLDLALASALKHLSRHNCWRYWRAAAQSGWHPLKALVQSEIAVHFLPATADPDYLELTEAELAGFLRHQQLNIDTEMDLLAPIERWLGNRPAGEWARSGPALLRAVRQNRLTPAEAREFALCPLLARCGIAGPSDLLPTPPATTTGAAAAAAAGAAASADELDQEPPSTPPMPPARTPHEAIFVCGGWEGLQNDPNFGPSDAVQVYNYHERVWIRHSQPPGPVLGCGHAYSGCVLLHHCVYVVGGYVQNRATSYQGPTAAVKAYDLRRRCWQARAAMHSQRNYVSAAALDGFVYAVGGHNGRNRLNTAERYCPEENRWHVIAPLQQVRSDAGCVGMQHFLYVCGGFNGHQFFSSVERYDPAVNQWTHVAAMQSVRSGVSVCECEGQLYALGGNNGNSRLATVERYDPEANQWAPMPQMLTQRSNFSAALLRGEIYAIGGWSDQTNSTVSVVEKWRPGPTSPWELVPNLQLPASANCCCDVRGLHLVEDLLVPSGQLVHVQQQQQQNHVPGDTAEFESSSN